MPRKPKTIVLDSWAIMSYLQGEPSAEKVADIIADAHEDNVPLLMSIGNNVCQDRKSTRLNSSHS